MFLFVTEMKQLTSLFLLLPFIIWAQDETPNATFVLTPEIMLGISAEANDFFPERDLQWQSLLNFGWVHNNNPQQWAHRLKAPKTGISLGYTNFGNQQALGNAITLLPFIEFKALRSKRLKILTGMGVSYFDTKYDEVSNPFNQAITTDLVWSFRAFFYYTFLQGESLDWRLGVGYFHHSNGHTRLPNQGLNSFLGSLSAEITFGKDTKISEEKNFEKSSHQYFSLRTGYGVNALSLAYNDKKPVYTIAAGYGKVFNKTYRLGGGFYYRFYQHYYDYINENESLVQDGREFEDFKEHPVWNSSAFGIFGTAEILLNHVGIEVQLGLNLSKPAYKIDWRINEGWDNTPRDIPEFWVLGEFNTKFKLKHAIASRMGIKYYVFGTHKQPIHNIFVGFHINSNLGQADFTEVSLGYVYSFDSKEK